MFFSVLLNVYTPLWNLAMKSGAKKIIVITTTTTTSFCFCIRNSLSPLHHQLIVGFVEEAVSFSEEDGGSFPYDHKPVVPSAHFGKQVLVTLMDSMQWVAFTHSYL